MTVAPSVVSSRQVMSQFGNCDSNHSTHRLTVPHGVLSRNREKARLSRFSSGLETGLNPSAERPFRDPQRRGTGLVRRTLHRTQTRNSLSRKVLLVGSALR